MDLNHRALLFKLVGETTSYVVHGIYPHDEAYEMAAKVKLTLNPVNGMPAFHEVAVALATPASQKTRAPERQRPGPAPLIQFSAADLIVTLGLPPEVAERACQLTVPEAVEAYRAAARLGGTVDYAEAAAIAAAYLRRHPLAGVRVLVDEGQDFRPCHWQLVRALAAEGPNDIFIAEDAYQRIYGHRVVLSAFGIATRGRSRKLRLNYRTTRQNLAWAVSVLAGQDVVDSDGEQESMRGYVSARGGPSPQVRHYATPSEELDAAAETLRGWLESGAEPGAIGVLVRDRYTRDRVVAGLDDRGVRIRALETGTHRKDVPVVLTMHRAKGMEFAKVLIFGVGADFIPAGLAAYDFDQSERDDALLRERSLLYVAATRARDELVISHSGQRSELLPATPSIG